MVAAMSDGSLLNRNEEARPLEFPDGDTGTDCLTRRVALARLGIAATVAYTAPTILQLDRSANAKAKPSPCHGNNRRKCRGDVIRGRIGGGKGKSGGRDKDSEDSDDD